jgi:hypothetical protein
MSRHLTPTRFLAVAITTLAVAAGATGYLAATAESSPVGSNPQQLVFVVNG